MTAKPESLARIVWDEANTLEGRSAVLPGVLLVTFTVATLFWHPFRTALDLGRIAEELRLVAFVWGVCLLALAGGITRQVIRNNLKQRWFESPDAAWLHLIDPSGARVRELRATAAAVGPRSAVVAAPVFAGLGAACLGFGAAMQLALASIPGDDDRAWGPVPVWMVYGGVLTFALAMGLYRVSRTTRVLYVWARDQAASVAEAQADAERARLTALQAQMNPAFLFNALDFVMALARTDTPRAERVVERLSSVLRRGRTRSTGTLTTVAEEVTFIAEYLDVDRERFGSRLNVTFTLDPHAVDDAGADRVPPAAGRKRR